MKYFKTVTTGTIYWKGNYTGNTIEPAEIYILGNYSVNLCAALSPIRNVVVIHDFFAFRENCNGACSFT